MLFTSRPSHGGRGLKYMTFAAERYTVASPLTRGAWIEISSTRRKTTPPLCRPSHGGRGLKFDFSENRKVSNPSRPSHGGRGLKLLFAYRVHQFSTSPLTRGAWIEILACTQGNPHAGSPLTRGAWIEICSSSSVAFNSACRPSHGGRGLKLSARNVAI